MTPAVASMVINAASFDFLMFCFIVENSGRFVNFKGRLALMSEKLTIVLDALSNGNIEYAAALCKQWCVDEPASTLASNLSGVVAMRAGDVQGAIGWFKNATEIDACYGKAWFNLGIAYKQANLFSDALTCLRMAFQLEPTIDDIQYNLALLLHEQAINTEARAVLAVRPENTLLSVEAGWLLAKITHALGDVQQSCEMVAELLQHHNKHSDLWRTYGDLLCEVGKDALAEHAFHQALALSPKDIESLRGLGNLLVRRGRVIEGIQQLQRASELSPENLDVLIEYAQALVSNGWFLDARQVLLTALRRWPANAKLHFNLGMVEGQYGDRLLAERELRTAIDLDPGLYLAHNYLGTLLEKIGQLEEASACYEKTISLSSNFAEAYSNQANLLASRLQLDVAENYYRKAISLKPDFPEAHHNLGLLLLLTGHFQDGWREYEWRWKTPDVRKHLRAFSQSAWRGERIAGKRILVHAEQGFGDTIQFVRFIPLLAHQGSTVIVESPPPLFRLLSTMEGVDILLRRGEPIPVFDFHIPLLNLPGLMDTQCENIPASIPYLSSNEEERAFWRKRLPTSGSELCVGIVWAGNAKHANDRLRSLPVRELTLLADIENVQWFSLQKSMPSSPVNTSNIPLTLTDWTTELRDYADTAALIDELDLVITVDTSVAHLAGALGKPVWIMLPYVPDWRWMLDQKTSPWYPTAVLYRQPQTGDWMSVLVEIKQDLIALSKKKRPAGRFV